VTPEERQKWTAIRDAWEDKIIAKARKAGRVPVVDCTAKDFPVPAAILRELSELDRPEVREAAFRKAAELRRKSASLHSLAKLLEAKGGNTEPTLAKAQALDADAERLESLHRRAA
jgi:hypothetical protein